jgi:hydroxymethylbilane synthase
VLAAAGLRRLGFSSRISATLPVAACVPAPGQGIIAIEIRRDDDRLRDALERITDAVSAAALTAERSLVEALGGGCQTPIGALAAAVEENQLELVATVVSIDGSRAIRASGRATHADAAALGIHVARQLIDDGADQILDDVHRAQAAVEGIQP